MPLRPAYRYALAALVATVLAVSMALWALVPASIDPTEPPPLPSPEEREARRDKAPINGVPKRETPIVGDPGLKERVLLLDEIEEYETERFGVAEAARRRRAREQLLEDRLEILNDED